MYIDFFLDRFRANAKDEAMIWQDKVYTYQDLLTDIEEDLVKLRKEITESRVVSLEADFSPQATALLLALIELGCVIVPLTESVANKKDEFKEIAEVETSITVLKNNDGFTIEHESRKATHEILTKLKSESHPGLILFSSGSTGTTGLGSSHSSSGTFESESVAITMNSSSGLVSL